MKAEISENILSLIKSQQSLLLSTLSSSQSKTAKQPFASYAPYAYDLKTGELFVLLSDLASHSLNVIEHPQASVLIIEDESKSDEIFARKRVQYDVTAIDISREDRAKTIVQDMTERLGDTVSLIASLADFRLFALKAQGGRYVEGFGKAFTIKQGFAEDLNPAMQDINKSK